ncbi:MAG: hypothetical protein IJ017_03350 [Oscillospiraceae bacterium]|nr:hypothetical protein [Oscillospiraceae bacterium]
MGYRKYAKDYEIEYRDRLGKKRPEAVRIYVGPYFRFTAPAEKIAKLKWFYLILTAVSAAALIIPMCIDCGATRTWYVQMPAVIAWIPWVLAACSVWRIWTAKDKVEREHYDMMYQRISGASVFMIIFGLISTIGSTFYFGFKDNAMKNLAVLLCCAVFLWCGAAMFVLKKNLKMTEEENPEKPQAKK